MTSQAPPSRKPAATQADPLIGRVFNDRFKVQRLIARGGLSAVYRAEQAPLGRACALKVLKPRYEGSVQFEFHRRFFLEASIASKLTHPNNVTVFDYGHTDDDVYFMAMELLDGRTLAQTIRAEAPFSEERILHIARQVCRALREAHSLGVIHRDIKPSNVFIVEHPDEQDFVKVIDYGLVKDIRSADTTEDLTQAGLFMGSPKYVAPEQIQGEAVDGRSDIYALGIMLYEMATGRVPFDRGSDVQTLIAHVKDQPPPLREMLPSCQVSEQLEQLIFRCIAKSPVDRYASMDELLHLLKQGADAALTATLMSDSGRMLPSGQSGAIAPLAARTATVSGPHVFLAGGPTGPSAPLDPAVVAEAVRREQRTTRLRNLAAAGIVALGLAGFAVAFIARQQPSEPAPPSTIGASTQPSDHETGARLAEPEAPSAVPAPATATARRIRLTTEPAGATVQLDGPRGKELCASTPCELTLEIGPSGDGMKLYVSRKGFVPVSKSVAEDDQDVSLRLLPIAGRVRVPPTSTQTGVGPYKFDPY